VKLHALQDSSCLLINVRQKLVGETSDPDHPQEIQLGEKFCWHIVILRDTRFLDEYSRGTVWQANPPNRNSM